MFAAVIWFQFAVYPGHTYLHGPSQTFVPQFERLSTPGFLTRDLVATHTSLSLTLFDEASLFLNRTAHLDWPAVLELQQISSRVAGLAGIVLLAGAAGLAGWWPLALAAGMGFLGGLPGIGIAPFSLEATPYSLAFGFILLAAGLLAREKPLLGGCMGGLALIYDPVIASPFWLILLVALVVDRSWRRVVRATLPLLAVFALLLANFAQLQPTSSEADGVFTRLPPAVEAVQRFRTGNLWVSQWQMRDLLFYLAFFSVVAWAGFALWPTLSRPLRWLLLGLPATGLLSLPVSVFLLSVLHLRAVPLIQPAHWVLFAAVLGALVCVVAAWKAKSVDRWIFWGVPVLLVIAAWTSPALSGKPLDTTAAADWARANTWGASMFLFPDAGQSLAPGAFRAESLRPVWVDWQTGALCDSSDEFAIEWQERWNGIMSGRALKNLRGMLLLPVDYVVVTPRQALRGVQPVYADSHWLIYDAMDLRNRHFSALR